MLNIVGLYGKTGVGKDALANFVVERFKDINKVAKVFKFALPVYELTSVIFGTSVEFLGERGTKETRNWFAVTQESLERANEYFTSKGMDKYADFSYVWGIFCATLPIDNEVDLPTSENLLFGVYASPRELLQWVGTELGRELVDKDIWLKLLMQSINNEDYLDVAIVTDVRFENEASLLVNSSKEENGINSCVVEITRGNNSLETAFTSHKSENPLPRKYIKSTICNEGSLEDFLNQGCLDIAECLCSISKEKITTYSM